MKPFKRYDEWAELSRLRKCEDCDDISSYVKSTIPKRTKRRKRSAWASGVIRKPKRKKMDDDEKEDDKEEDQPELDDTKDSRELEITKDNLENDEMVKKIREKFRKKIKILHFLRKLRSQLPKMRLQTTRTKKIDLRQKPRAQFQKSRRFEP